MKKSQLRQLIREEINSFNGGPQLEFDSDNYITFSIGNENWDDEKNEELFDEFDLTIEWQSTAMDMAKELEKVANSFKTLAKKYPNETFTVYPDMD